MLSLLSHSANYAAPPPPIILGISKTIRADVPDWLLHDCWPRSFHKVALFLQMHRVCSSTKVVGLDSGRAQSLQQLHFAPRWLVLSCWPVSAVSHASSHTHTLHTPSSGCREVGATLTEGRLRGRMTILLNTAWGFCDKEDTHTHSHRHTVHTTHCKDPGCLR